MAITEEEMKRYKEDHKRGTFIIDYLKNVDLKPLFPLGTEWYDLEVENFTPNNYFTLGVYDKVEESASFRKKLGVIYGEIGKDENNNEQYTLVFSSKDSTYKPIAKVRSVGNDGDTIYTLEVLKGFSSVERYGFIKFSHLNTVITYNLSDPSFLGEEFKSEISRTIDY